MDRLASKQRSRYDRRAAEQVSTAIPRTLTQDDYVAIRHRLAIGTYGGPIDHSSFAWANRSPCRGDTRR